MGAFKDITGQKFGKLLVNEFAKKEKTVLYWKCTCDCGNERIVRGSDLKSGGTRSCGCLKQGRTPANKTLDRRLAIIKREYSRFKEQAKSREWEVTLTLNEFELLVTTPCHYCGIEGSKKREDFDSKRNLYISDCIIYVNGIDRINSEVGYTKENVVPCCATCNVAKLNLSLDSFVNWLQKVYNFNYGDFKTELL